MAFMCQTSSTCRRFTKSAILGGRYSWYQLQLGWYGTLVWMNRAANSAVPFSFKSCSAWTVSMPWLF